MNPPQLVSDIDDDEASDTYSVAAEQVVILVDPYSTGCLIGKEIHKRGYALIALWTSGFNEDMKLHIPKAAGIMPYHAECEQVLGDLEATATVCREAAGSLQIIACLAGGEAGVDLADALSEHLELRTNGTDIPNRRDKKVQQELIRKAGLRSVRQAGSANFENVESFLRTEPFPVVLKPVESAGSDGVKLCHTFEEAKEHFSVLMNSQMVNGGQCPEVLCQEFLRGKEYVVDHGAYLKLKDALFCGYHFFLIYPLLFYGTSISRWCTQGDHGVGIRQASR